MPRPKNHSPGLIAKWKTSLLHLSIKYNFQNLTDYLITHGCNLDTQDEFGKTPLLKATYNLQSQTVKILLTENADMLVADSNGKNALQTAMEFPSISECRPIIKSFIAKITDVCSSNEEIASLLSEIKCPLSQIIYFGDADLTRKMLTLGYKVNQRNPSDGNTALHVAVMLLDLENVKVLLEYGADRNIINGEGYMPFFSIFTSKQPVDATAEVLSLVMPVNVDWTECEKDGKMKIYPIFVNSSTEYLRIFLKTYSVDMNARDVNGKTPLHYLVEYDKIDGYEIFKTASIDIDARDNRGRTPLHIAAGRGNADAVQFLLGNGADTNALYDGQTPIYLAFGREATLSPQRCIALLLQNSRREHLTSIYTRIFSRFEEDKEAITFSKSVTAHLAMLERAGWSSLTFELGELEPYYRRLWRKRAETVMRYHWMYKEELEEMQKVMVYGSVSMFDVLADDDCGRMISRYAWKVERVEELERKFFKEEYAFYYKTRLTMRFENAKKLARWRYELSEILSDTTMFDSSHVVNEKIVRLLEYDDLKKFK